VTVTGWCEWWSGLCAVLCVAVRAVLAALCLSARVFAAVCLFYV
jgi:hypothetical protein